VTQVRLEELEKERDQVDMERAILDKRKSEAEQPEREAKERHEKAWEGEWISLFADLITCCFIGNFQQYIE